MTIYKTIYKFYFVINHSKREPVVVGLFLDKDEAWELLEELAEDGVDCSIEVRITASYQNPSDDPQNESLDELLDELLDEPVDDPALVPAYQGHDSDYRRDAYRALEMHFLGTQALDSNPLPDRTEADLVWAVGGGSYGYEELQELYEEGGLELIFDRLNPQAHYDEVAHMSELWAGATGAQRRLPSAQGSRMRRKPKHNIVQGTR